MNSEINGWSVDLWFDHMRKTMIDDLRRELAQIHAISDAAELKTATENTEKPKFSDYTGEKQYK